MRTLMHSLCTTRADAMSSLVPRAWRRLALLPALIALGACGDIARMVTPGSRAPNGPAMIAFTASVPRRVASVTDVVALNVTASYLRADGTRVRIGSQSIALTSDAVQSVPIPVDVGTCLADVSRDVGAGTSTDASCAVVLNLALLINGVVVDEQVVGPLRLQPGATTTVAQPVTLIDLASVELQSRGEVVSSAAPVRLYVDSTLLLSARVLDTRGQVVTDRAVTWSSDAPAVASVNANSGAVTTLTVGTATITARAGTVSARATIRVLRAPAALTITVGTGSGTGTVRSIPAGIDCRASNGVLTGVCTFAFPGDSVVSLAATANAGSVFSAWSEACTAARVGEPCQLVMSQAREARVGFSALRRVSVAPAFGSTGNGLVSGSNGFDCRIAASTTTGNCAVDIVEGSALQLTAAPDILTTGGTLQFFAGWGGACASASGSTCTLTATTTDLAATAQFFDVQQLAVSPTGNGGGLITGGSTIACARNGGANTGTCAERATYATSVTLTAVADAQSSFLGWTGACTGMSPTCTTTLTQHRNVSATFSRRQVTLTVNVSGPGSGSIQVGTGAPCVLAAGQSTNSCTTTFDAGVAVTINANASANSAFAGFDGACSGTGGCALVLDQSQTVNAAFTVARFPLTITLSGTGAGTVVLSDGSRCSLALGQTTVTCTSQVNAGLSVGLSTTPTVESTFEGYAGACNGQAACSVSMTAPRTVAVTLTRKQLRLSLLLSGTGAGTVTLNGAPVCALVLAQGSQSCVRMVDYGSTVSLAGVVTPESVFDSFAGACAGTTSCSFVATTTGSVTASIRRRQVPLSITLVGTGAGTVSIGNVPMCALAVGQREVTCSRLVDAGSTITITGAAAALSSFNGFSGGCTGTGACALLLGVVPANVTAVFTHRQVPLTLQLRGQGGGSVNVNGAVACTIALGETTMNCTRQVEYGTSVVVTASPSIESSFNGFDTDCSGAACTLTMTTDRTVSATFTPRLFPLVLTLFGPGSGSVQVNGITECALLPGAVSISCTKMLDVGATAIITNRTSSGVTLSAYSRDCGGVPRGVTTCTLLMNMPHDVGVTFPR